MEPVPRAGVGRLKRDTPEFGGAGLAFDAVVLSGGRSSRLGGYPKPSLVFEGATLLERALGAAHAARRAVVVGPEVEAAASGPRQVVFTLEEPRFSGPLAALGAGLAALGEPHGAPHWVAVLAADLPRADAALGPLLSAAAAGADADAVLAEDEGGRWQPLLGLYRRGPLERAVAALADDGGLADRPLKHLVARLAVQPLRLPPGLTDDVDTWPAAERWGIRRPDGPGAPSEAEEPTMSDTAPGADRGTPPAGDDKDEILRAWCAELIEALELDGLEVDIDAVLGLAGVAAHAVVRPAAPLTTFLAAYAAGVAAGSGQAGEKAAMDSAIGAARRLAKARAEQAGTEE
ncbi:NTP transferase domain-containing protein [Sinomonas albida]|uniref:NTP transferase domain-containing protein n=1 Tax=Sinomonas albida TaxID=369942 RepID=UPI001F1F0968|nr:NTP transferase domain-containing protein [Sinomonas albida]